MVHLTANDKYVPICPYFLFLRSQLLSEEITWFRQCGICKGQSYHLYLKEHLIRVSTQIATVVVGDTCAVRGGTKKVLNAVPVSVNPGKKFNLVYQKQFCAGYPSPMFKMEVN